MKRFVAWLMAAALMFSFVALAAGAPLRLNLYAITIGAGQLKFFEVI